jgi:hypothetical protein
MTEELTRSPPLLLLNLSPFDPIAYARLSVLPFFFFGLHRWSSARNAVSSARFPAWFTDSSSNLVLILYLSLLSLVCS